MAVETIIGDICKCEVDAIVNSVGTDAGVYGRLCKQIVLASKSNALESILKGKRNNKIGDVFYIQKLGNWKLGCEYLINVVTPHKKYDLSGEKLYKAYEKVIEQAIELNCKSIAIPLFGTGANGYEDSESFRTCQSVCYGNNWDIEIYIVLYKGVSAITNFYDREHNYGYGMDQGKKLFNYAFTMSEINNEEIFTPSYTYSCQYDFVYDYITQKNISYEMFNMAGIDNKKRNHWKNKLQLDKDEVFLLIYVTGMNKTEAIQFMVYCNYSLNPTRKQDQFMYEYLTGNTKYSDYDKFAEAMNKYCRYKVYIPSYERDN